MTDEQSINVEAVRVAGVIRHSVGALAPLMGSIRDEGLRHPIVVWSDGALLDGVRRHRAYLILGRPTIPAVFVNTIEDAAKHLTAAIEDDYLAAPMKASEMCRLWELLRHLDAPAAAQRADAARRRGVALRRQTQAGKRRPGRQRGAPDDYVLDFARMPFGMSLTTARRLWAIYAAATGQVEDEKRATAREALADIDAGRSSIYANYARLMGGRVAPVSQPRAVQPAEAAPAARQQAAWGKSLPQMEGLVAGLVELGPPNAELTWEQVGPVHARLAAIRRDLEKMIKQMKELNQS
jgi:hypothetical protein